MYGIGRHSLESFTDNDDGLDDVSPEDFVITRQQARSDPLSVTQDSDSILKSPRLLSEDLIAIFIEANIVCRSLVAEFQIALDPRHPAAMCESSLLVEENLADHDHCLDHFEASLSDKVVSYVCLDGIRVICLTWD